MDQYQKEFVKLIKQNTGRYRTYEVFRDFCELAALSISNAVDRLQYAEREARYIDIIQRYTREEAYRFPLMLAQIVESLECRFHDCLGQLFMALDLSDHWKGQFFTPYEVSLLMAKISLSDAADIIEHKGFITLNEPTCGGGAMVIACAHALKDERINYQQVMHVTAQDIDQTAVHMSYIQLSLLHIPAIVLHGNSLDPTKVWSHWATPAHVLGFWDSKLRHAASENAAITTPKEEEAPLPLQPIIKQREDVIKHRIAKAEQLSLFA
ncbi:MAG TPA: N-6 DNA methylase [Noviherbaspirillum sp.]|nr:N-6 DNA methylase [Noviherbaspirillum sp.]